MYAEKNMAGVANLIEDAKKYSEMNFAGVQNK